ncbi:hypothetical protein CF150_15303 [Pseudomonas sp. CF150]|nr:hypothetical protein CF150_15303 [Pseudomonas sp. CF150]
MNLFQNSWFRFFFLTQDFINIFLLCMWFENLKQIVKAVVFMHL